MYGDSQDQTSGVYALDEDGGLTLLHEYQDGEYSLEDLIEEFGFGRMDGGTENGDEIIVLAPKEIRELKRGDVVSFRLSGAGGYGAPHERDPDLVRRDVADGYVSAAAAAEIYGLDDTPDEAKSS